MRSDKPFRRSGYILSLTHITESGNDGDTYMVIGVEKDKFTCAPFRSLQLDDVIFFKDTNIKDKGWQHISCSFSGKTVLATATYLVGVSEFQYSHDLSTYNEKKLKFGEQSYRVCVNCQKNSENQGLEAYKYRELRVWREERSYTDIRRSRFQQLDPKGSKLTAYFRLATGGQSDEVNYANLTQVLTTNGVAWREDADSSKVCPLGTFYDRDAKPAKESTCYSQPLKQLRVATRFDTNKWRISPKYSVFTNSFAEHHFQR